MIKAGIVGGAGYTGGELLRLLIRHPLVNIVFVHSNSNAGNPLHKVHADLLGDTDLHFTNQLTNNIDVLFLCVGHGEAKKFLTEYPIAASIKIIDLSQDFRLKETALFQDRSFVYGLPELNKEAIKQAQNIANPGCFATAIQLSLLPLAKAGCLQEVNITGITGSTGAGQSLSGSAHFSWRANNIQAYKTLTHQHLFEIGESVLQLQPSSAPELNFVPWRGDFTRGIFASTVLQCSFDEHEIKTMFIDFYAAHPFTHLSNEPIFLKQVVNTNKCLLQIEKVGSKLVVHASIDNLLKGASGQALQNMNLLFGLEETTGLQLKAGFF
jgi:N-acetyl-gamma-glutamyl-phosphate reductase